MPKRIQLSLNFDEYAHLLTKVKKHCSTNKITLTEFVANALQMAFDTNPHNPINDDSLSHRVASLEQFLDNINKDISQLKHDVESLKNFIEIKPTDPEPKTKAKKVIPEACYESIAGIASMGHLKNWGVFSRGFTAGDDDIGRIFDGNDGSLWKYLGIRKNPPSKNGTKTFELISR